MMCGCIHCLFCPFVALLKVKYAEKLHIVLSCRHLKNVNFYYFNLLCVVFFCFFDPSLDQIYKTHFSVYWMPRCVVCADTVPGKTTKSKEAAVMVLCTPELGLIQAIFQWTDWTCVVHANTPRSKAPNGNTLLQNYSLLDLKQSINQSIPIQTAALTLVDGQGSF